MSNIGDLSVYEILKSVCSVRKFDFCRIYRVKNIYILEKTGSLLEIWILSSWNNIRI